MKTFAEVIEFHGHACPGLALGYRVSISALKELGDRSSDEELIAIVENNSCAVDAVQVVTGCTFGKGNLLFRDYGKQVYTFIQRPSGKGIRVSIDWKAPEETDEEMHMWDLYTKGDRSDRVLQAIHDRKARKLDTILNLRDEELMKIQKGTMELPGEARIYPSLTCALCGEKMMEPRARVLDGKIVCIPCCERNHEER